MDLDAPHHYSGDVTVGGTLQSLPSSLKDRLESEVSGQYALEAQIGEQCALFVLQGEGTGTVNRASIRQLE